MKKRYTIASHAALTWCALGAASCAKEPPPAAEPPPPPPPSVAVELPAPAPAPEEPKDTGIVILADVGFQTPESVTYDAALDVYYVANINGAPLDKDDNGFISKVTPEGEVTLEFITAQAEGVELNAPKGMGVYDGTLYVADIDQVRLFDTATGTSKGSVKLPGATFVNGLKVAADGAVWVSDSGLKPDFSSSGTDALWKITSGKAKKVLGSKKLGGPNGVLPTAGGVWVASFGSGELYFVSDAGKQDKIQKLPKGSLDGIVLTNDGRTLVSSWEASAVFAGTPGGEFVELLGGVTSPADIGYDTKRNRLLVPLFQKNSVVLAMLDVLAAEAR